ncbi:MAG: hypothetical protein IIC53_05555 [Proteobacteria bacterium]|nr:hypothetical protein [Pseudomonadota bacterium]
MAKPSAVWSVSMVPTNSGFESSTTEAENHSAMTATWHRRSTAIEAYFEA